MTNEQLKNIKKAIIYHGGATLNNDLMIEPFNSGYMVSVKGFEYKTKVKRLNKRLLTIYNNFAVRLGAYVGLWLNDGFVYLDISKNISVKNVAIAEGLKEKQTAIYDCNKQETIFLK